MKLGPNDLHTAARLFVPDRLRLGREIRGLTRAALARKIEVSASAVSQFELGRARPEAGTVGRIALALMLPVSFFATATRVSEVSLECCHFRSLRSATQRSRRRLTSQGTLLYEFVDVVEKYVELPHDRVRDLARCVATEEDIERCAASVRKEWGLGSGPIPNMVQLLESRGCIVYPISHGSKKVDAFSFWRKNRSFIFLILDKGSTSRSRFDAAHELGHLIMHADARPGDAVLEREANRFASAFLLPRESFGRESPTRLDWGHLRELKERWKVSIAAILHRAFKLGRISVYSYRRGFVHLNRTNQRKNEPCEPPYEAPTALVSALRLVERSGLLGSVLDEMGIDRVRFDAILPGLLDLR